MTGNDLNTPNHSKTDSEDAPGSADKTSSGNNSAALASMHCEVCRIDAPRLTDAEITDLQIQFPHWQIARGENFPILTREFRFNNFVEALEFTRRVGELAEAANHHPRLTTEWGRVTVEWWTHKIKGLHKNDFVMAAKTDQLQS